MSEDNHKQVIYDESTVNTIGYLNEFLKEHGSENLLELLVSYIKSKGLETMAKEYGLFGIAFAENPHSFSPSEVASAIPSQEHQPTEKKSEILPNESDNITQFGSLGQTAVKPNNNIDSSIYTSSSLSMVEEDLKTHPIPDSDVFTVEDSSPEKPKTKSLIPDNAPYLSSSNTNNLWSDAQTVSAGEIKF